MDEFVVERDGTSLRLVKRSDFLDSGCHFLHYDCFIKTAGLEASVGVTDMVPSSISDLFAKIAINWRGWDGVMVAEALESQLQLEATCDRLGHISLKVTVRPNSHGFLAQAMMTLGAGELDDFARRAKLFFTV